MVKELQRTPLYEFIEEFQRLGLAETHLLSQALALLGCALLAWVASRVLQPRLRQAGLARWRVSSEGMARVMYPVLFWLFVEMVIVFWPSGQSVTLLRLGSSLLSVLVIVRTVAYLLQESFIQSEWVKKAVRLLAWLIWLVFALHITGVLPEIQKLLDSVAFAMGKQRISLLMVVNGGLSVAVTMLVAVWLGRLAERRVMSATSLDLSFRVVATKVMRTVLVVVGVMIALPIVGIDLTVLSVFGGALGVGLGFGLQKIASNYVSGFIILLDGSVRIGDLVNIEGRQGSISGITSRYVVLKLGDGSEAIIPNEALITSTVLNLSHSDSKQRVVLPVQVAYDSDLEAVGALLVAQTQGEDRILAEPEPAFFVRGFGESGIDLELAFWIGDSDKGTLALRSDLNMKIWRAFREHGIEIPYPRRDLHLIAAAQDKNFALDQTSSTR